MKSSPNQPIGIFDSGIGGLTVAKAIKQHLPNEQFLYFGDTAHLPYGEKSSHAIKSYISNIAEFLKSKNCKVLVIACNSASSVFDSDSELQQEIQIPVIDVILPVVQEIVEDNNKTIGVIGTHQTIGSDIYAKKIREARPELNVESLATPLLAPMIEEGFIDNSISKAVINDYLSQFPPIESLVLGCTHYPLVKEEINDYFSGKVKLLDAPNVVANRLKDFLQNEGLLAEDRGEEHQFYVSDYTPTFEKTAQLFFGSKVNLEKVNIHI